jgi:DNA-binding CsgD family transcriptional regulator
VLGTRFRPALAAKMVNLPRWKEDAALSALYRSGLVRAETETSAAFVHPFVGQSLYYDLAAPVRARLHARAFKLLCAHGLEAEAVEHAIWADLVGDQAAITVLERAGRSAMGSGALGTAVKYLRAAAHLAGDRASPALLLALGETLLISGRPGEAIGTYERLRAQADLQPADRVQTLRMLGRALFATAAHDQATRRFAEAAAVADTYCDKAVARVLLDDAVTSWFTLGPAHSLPLATRARGLAANASEPLRRHANAIWGLVALLAGDPVGLSSGEAATQKTMSGSELSELWWSFGPLGTLAITALFTERFADVEHALEAIRATATRVGATEATAGQLVTKAVLATRLGRLSEALAAAEEATALADLVPYCEGLAGYAKAEVLLLMDRLTECADWCHRIEAIAASRGQSYVLLRLWHVRARMLHYAGDHAGACLLYEQIEQMTNRIGIAEPCAVPWGRHALISYLANDRLDDSRRVVDWLERGAARLPCLYPRIAALTGRALLAEVSGDSEAAERNYQAAMLLHQHVNLPMDHIETLMIYGSFLRRRGKRIRARAVLADAVTMADVNQARWLGKQAREEVAAAGGRRHRTVNKSTRLTAQEARIARLAAAGQSNKAIASRLIISSKTVEYHLGRVYTKLGICSRHQLMPALQRCEHPSS